VTAETLIKPEPAPDDATMANDHPPDLPTTPIAQAAPTAQVVAPSAQTAPTPPISDAQQKAATRSVEATHYVDAKRRLRSERWKDFFIRAVFVAFLLGVWQVAHIILVKRLDIWSPALFCSPAEVGKWMLDGFGLSYVNRACRSRFGFVDSDY